MIVGVSGTNGFIGQNLLRELLNTEGIEVIQFGRTQSELICDSSNFVQWSLEDIDYDYDVVPKLDKYFHLAWAGIPNYDDAIHLNQLENHTKFLSAIINKGCRSVLSSGTCFEYLNPYGEISEEFPVEGRTNYAIGKLELYKLLQEMTALEDFQLIWTRIFYVFGEGQPRNTLFGSFRDAIATGDEEFRILSGGNRLDYLNVSQVVKYMIRLLFSDEANGVYNLGSGVGTELSALLNAWKEQEKSEINIVDLASTPKKSFWADISKMRSVLS